MKCTRNEIFSRKCECLPWRGGGVCIMCTIVQKSVKKGSRESADRFIDGNLGMNEKD